ncbi:MAG TPA: methionine adenosyltransferase domain-containing protein, partial [Candidatus Limnocylindrales bacterium]|nr:methionine adenosyltransferase domain-containing protein [Candidatus Limnocylindrales bacterium]
IGIAEPLSVSIETFGTGHVPDETISRLIDRHFDLRPAAIISALDLRRPIYRQTAAYGHFGRPDLDLPWERTDKAALLAAEAGVTQPDPVPAG